MRWLWWSPVVGVLLFTDAGLARQNWQVNDQVQRTVTLSPGAMVRITGINGLVELETSDSQVADVRVTVQATSRQAMERRPIQIDSTASSLTIATNKERQRDDDGERVRHDVRVRLPRKIDLEVAGVNGAVTVGALDGSVRLNGINGRTTVTHAGSASEISSINGRTIVSVARLAAAGLRVSAVNGGIEIGLPAAINANLEVSSVNGGIDSDFPVTVTKGFGRGRMEGSLGSGGPPIVITAVNGGVRLTRR